MARFALDLVISIEALDTAEENGVEVLTSTPYTEDTDLASVRLAANSLHDFLKVMENDDSYNGDWEDDILDAVIIDY